MRPAYETRPRPWLELIRQADDENLGQTLVRLAEQAAALDAAEHQPQASQPAEEVRR